MKNSVKKGDKGEQAVIDTLNLFKDDYFLINNLILIGDNNVSHQFDHILIRPNGVFIIETKNYFGKITGKLEDTMWNKTYPRKGKIVSEKFMNPVKQNNAHVRYIKKIIGKDISLVNIVVFVNNDVSHLGIYTVVNLEQLYNRIYLWENDKPLSHNQMVNIYNLLLSLEADIQSEDHVSNIKELKKLQREKRQDMILVIEKGLCPICGNKVKMNKNIYTCPVCKYTLKV